MHKRTTINDKQARMTPLTKATIPQWESASGCDPGKAELNKSRAVAVRFIRVWQVADGPLVSIYRLKVRGSIVANGSLTSVASRDVTQWSLREFYRSLGVSQRCSSRGS